MSGTELRHVVESVVALMGTHSGRLVAVTVAVPRPDSPGAVAELLVAELVLARLGRIEVRATQGTGGLRLLSAEFVR